MVAAGRALGAEAWGRRGGQCRPKAGSPVVSGSQRLAWWWLAQHRCSRDGGRGGGHPTPHCDVTSLRQQVTASWVFSANLHVVDVWKIK